MAQKYIEGLKEVNQLIMNFGDLPRKVVSIAAKKGANIAKQSSKKGGWIDQTGNLRRGIIVKGERSSVAGKKVFDITMDPKMNDIFQKKTKSGNVLTKGRGNKLKAKKGNYYYPASQEFGFRTANGGFVPGFHFLEKGLTDNNNKIEKIIVQTVSKEIEKIK